MHSRLFYFLLSITIFTFVTLVVLGVLYSRRPAQPKIEKIPDQKITIIEGWNNREISGYLTKQLAISEADFLSAEKLILNSPDNFLFGQLETDSLEGFLFPDTYLVAPKSSAEIVLSKLLNNFEIKFGLASKGSKQQAGRYIIPGYESLKINGKFGLSLYEVVTLASILEKETGRDVSKGGADSQSRLDAERKIVAGIFLNRLAVGQALQSDATINYATGKNSASPSNNDLEVSSGYNTYKYPGLPPGPISNPSLSSLSAVLFPTKTNYFYFLHKQPSGEVVYSRTFNEHVANKLKYLK